MFDSYSYRKEELRNINVFFVLLLVSVILACSTLIEPVMQVFQEYQT